MKKLMLLGFSVLLIFVAMPFLAKSDTMNYGNITLSGGSQAGNFTDVWDLTKCDMVISFTYDANGLVDDSGAHAWSELGIRAVGYGNFNPTFGAEGAGVWLATDYDWTANTFDPDPSGPTLDLDDKLILQKAGGHGEGDYNLPSTPPTPGNNHRFWFDRDGVDQWQAQSPLAVDGDTYNTGGTYEIVITLHATDATSGTAYMTINDLNQGFETDGKWNTMELSPAGMTFTGDMTQMQVFYGLYGYGATHSVAFQDITVVQGCFASVQGAEVRITPETFNVQQSGNWVTGHITLPPGYTLEDVISGKIVSIGGLGISIPGEFKGGTLKFSAAGFSLVAGLIVEPGEPRVKDVEVCVVLYFSDDKESFPACDYIDIINEGGGSKGKK